MIINNNIPALNTHRQMGVNQNAMQNSMEKLSSGLRINRAGDDAAGLSISEKMRSQIRGLDQGSRNAQDGISMIQTAEGGLDEVHSILQRARELAVQSSNETNVDVDHKALDDEFQQLISEIDRIKEKSQFNTQNLFTGDAGGGDDGKVNLQVGANVGDTITLDLTTKGIHLGDLQTDHDLATLDLENRTNAQTALGKIEDAIADVSSGRSYLGAMQNRLEHTIANLDNASENLQAAESRIRDVDMAREMMDMTRSNILSQASQSMLAQANQQPQSVLQLLG